MKGKGRYQKQLGYVFLGIGATVTVITLAAMSFIYTSSIHNRYQNTVHQNLTISNSLSEASLSVINSALINLMQNKNIDTWANARDRSSFYFDATLAYRDISTLRTNFQTIPFYPAIMRLDEESFVISSLGSSSKHSYFMEETNLTAEQTETIMEYFKKNSGELILSVYSDQGKLTDLYYLLKHPFKKNNLIYIIRIPETSIFGEGSKNHYMIFNQDSLIACSYRNEEQDKSYKEIYHSLSKSYDTLPASVNSSLKIGNKTIYTTSPSNLPFKIAFIYSNYEEGFWNLFLYILIPATILSVMIYLLFSRLSSWLYKPVKNVLLDVISEDNGENIDEFHLIHQNSLAVKNLTSRLQEVINHNNSLHTLKFYRDLLFGLDITSSPVYEELSKQNISCCVAIFEFQENDNSLLNSDLFFSKSTLLGITQQQEHIHTININHTTCALIIECSSMEQCRQILTELCNQLSGEIDYHIALSDIRSGFINVHASYLEAQKILEYKYLYYSSRIITLDQIANSDSNNYYYPIITENKLIQELAKGKLSALDTFDDLIRENFTRRNLSPETIRSFIYSLLSTINRALQELKTSPKELLHHTISFEEYYVNWSQPNIISSIRNLLIEFINAVEELNSGSDHQLLVKMKNYIYSNYSEDIMLNDIADELGISAKYCSNLFKKLSNDNFKNFLNHYRIEQAKMMIEQNKDIKIGTLSQLVGFNSSTAFIRVFGKYTGMTPGAFAASVYGQTKDPQ